MSSTHPDWELRVIYAPPQNAAQLIAVVPRELVLEQLDRIPSIFDQAGAIPALLTGWSAFEAAARSIMPDNFARPQTSARLLEALASDGSITPAEADELRGLAALRNEAAHGQLNIAVTKTQIADLVAIARTLLDPLTADA